MLLKATSSRQPSTDTQQSCWVKVRPPYLPRPPWAGPVFPPCVLGLTRHPAQRVCAEGRAALWGGAVPLAKAPCPSLSSSMHHPGFGGVPETHFLWARRPLRLAEGSPVDWAQEPGVLLGLQPEVGTPLQEECRPRRGPCVRGLWAGQGLQGEMRGQEVPSGPLRGPPDRWDPPALRTQAGRRWALWGLSEGPAVPTWGAVPPVHCTVTA